MTGSEDTLLATRCQQGDDGAWRELVARHTRRVFAIAYKFCGRVDQAEDLTQEIFIKVYQSLERYRPADGKFDAWLGSVSRNHAIDHYRRTREERARRQSDPAILDYARSPADTPLQRVEREERVALVRGGLQSLPSDLREPIVLCDLQGISYDEAAAMLAIPLGTVKSRLNRGRLELAKRLAGRLGQR